MKVGIIGFGRRGEYFLKKCLKNGIQVYIYSTHLSSVNKPEGIVLCNTLQELINNKVDLVIISSADETHFAYAREIIHSRIPLLIEKPSTLSSEDTISLSKLSQKYKTLVFVGYNHRGSNLYIKTKRFLSGSSKLQSIHCQIFTNTFKTLTQTKQLFFNIASHYIDCLNYVLSFPRIHVLHSLVFQQEEKDMAGNISLLVEKKIPLDISFNFSAKCFPDLCESMIYFHTDKATAILSRNSLKIVSKNFKVREYFDDSEKFFTNFYKTLLKKKQPVWCTLQEDSKNLQILEKINKKTLFIKGEE